MGCVKANILYFTNLWCSIFCILFLNRVGMNKSIINKLFAVIITIIILLLALYVMPKAYVIFQDMIKDGFDQPIDIDNNLNLTGVNTITWITITGTSQIQTGTETFMDILNRDYKKTTYTLPKQPTEIPAGYTYNQRSNILINYMTENTIQLSSIKSDKAYMYIKLLRKPSFPVFIYRHWSSLGWYKRSGNLNLWSPFEKISGTDYIFDMSQIPYSKFSDGQNTTYNRLKDVNVWRSLYLALVYKAFDGNYIKEVIIFEKK